MDSMLWSDLWHTAKSARVYALCCMNYADKMRKRQRGFDWVITLVPGISAALFNVSAYITLIGAGLTPFINLLKESSHLALLPEKDLVRLDELYIAFSKILIDLEDSLQTYRLSPELSDIQIQKRITLLKNQIHVLLTDLNRIVRKIPNEDKLNEDAENYLQLKFTSH